MNIVQVECHILDTGYCLGSEHHMMQGGRHQPVECHALVALIHHPVHGWLLWDAGYAEHMWTATRPWPFWLYRRATPLYIDPQQAAARQLPRFGLAPDDIRTVLISHFHADHVAGLRDFPAARFVATRAAYADVATRRGWRALLRAVIPALLPDDFAARLDPVEAFTGPALPGLGATHDWLGDGSLRLVALPGHARGQMGLLAHTTTGDVLLAADGAWLARAIREHRPPARLTRLFVDDYAGAVATLERLSEFARACPDVRLVPTHCPEAFAREVAV